MPRPVVSSGRSSLHLARADEGSDRDRSDDGDDGADLSN
jgi:hypothetical protein